MKLFIAEDEAPARERLVESIQRVEPAAQIVGSAGSLRQCEAWLAANPPPDLMLLDVQLADGLSLELFSDRRLSVPTIFVTAFDEFVLDAFQAQAVDYLLKPVEREMRCAQQFAIGLVSPAMQRADDGAWRCRAPAAWWPGGGDRYC